MRVERAFSFVDLSGFTRFTDAQGDEEAVVVLTAFRAAVRDVTSEYGVRVAKWLGDGAMFVSTDVEPLVATVLELQHRVDATGRSLPLRSGIASGEVILFEGDDYIGSPVNLAARLCDVAAPYEVLASEEIADHLPDTAAASPARDRQVPGFVQPVPVVRVSPTATTDTEPLPPAVR